MIWSFSFADDRLEKDIVSAIALVANTATGAFVDVHVSRWFAALVLCVAAVHDRHEDWTSKE